MFGTNKKKSTGSPTIPKNDIEEEPIPTVDFKQIDKLLNSEIKDDDIQLTDADLEDPELLAQLSQIEGGGSIPKPLPQPKQQPVVTRTTTATTTTTIKKTIPQPKVRTEEDELNDLMNFDNDSNNNNNNNTEDDIIDHELIQKLEERHILYKKWAVYQNQQGNKTESLQYMKGSKIILEALTNLKEGLPCEVSILPPHLPYPPTGSQPQVQTPQKSIQPQPLSQPQVQTPPPQKNTNNIKSPPLTIQPVLSPKTEILSKETIEEEERLQTWDLIEEDFRRKHYKLTSEAVRLRDTDKIAAIHLLKESKGVNAIIDQIEINRKLGLAPPPFHFEEKVTSTEISFPEIKTTELVIKFTETFDITKALNSDYTISGEIPYPSPEQPSKFQSNSFNLNDTNLNFTTKIQIERKKTLQRCLEKKKMTLVFYSTKMFFMKSVVGKCEIKLSDLLTKCEINEKVPILKDGSKKETGSFINVVIRMREPLNQKEMKVSKEKVLVLDSPIELNPQKPVQQQSQQSQQSQQQQQQPTSTTATTTITTKSSETTTTTANTSPTVEPTTTLSSQEAPVTNNTTSTVTSPTITTTTTTTSLPTTSKSEPEKPKAPTPASGIPENTDDENVDDLEKVVSNNVLEFILEQTNQQIAQQGPKQDLLDRKQQVELKLMILETNVSAGILTMEDYVEQLKKAIEEDKKAALEYKKKGRQDLALKLMQRANIMKKEMEE